MYKKILRPLLFTFDPERIHDILVFFLRIPGISKLLGLFYSFQHDGLNREVFGINFRNPVGLAAGFDKNGEIAGPLNDIGFGFIEIGTVTPEAQAGNEKPRLFRLKEDQALINRMGFNNQGMKSVRNRLARKNRQLIIGGNIGKNKVTDNEDAYDDYEKCFKELYAVVDYFVVNVSSPNTPGLRALQDKEPLTKILTALQNLNNSMPMRKPILLKIAPDLDNTQLDDIVDIVQLTKLDGIIATNTTITRSDLKTDPAQLDKIGEGGLSGKPLKNRSTEVIQYIFKKSEGRIPIIGVGGIHCAEDAIEKFKAGASLVQLYTGFIYEGPGLIRKINRAVLSVEPAAENIMTG